MPHRTHDDLFRIRAEIVEQIPLWSTWTHRKNPSVIYTIIDLIVDEATDEIAVIYEHPSSLRFVRLAHSFLQEVTTPAWKPMSRFLRVG